MSVCGAVDPETGVRCTRPASHTDRSAPEWYPSHSHTKRGGAWYLEWVGED